MKKSKFWSLLLTCGAIGLAIGGANFNRKVAPAVFAHHEDHITQEVEGHSKVRPTLTPKELTTVGDAITDKAGVAGFFNNTGHNRSAHLTQDIDMEGADIHEIGVHGEYAGTFEGNGFTITNFRSGVLFNIIGGSGVVRNLNLRKTIRNSSAAGIAYQSFGTIDNCNVELTIDEERTHIGGFTRVGGGGAIINSKVDFVFTGTGVNSSTSLNAICYEGSNTNTNVSYYVTGADSSKVSAPSGVTLRAEGIDWGGSVELPPRVEVKPGYTDIIYVEHIPMTTEVEAEVVNAEGKEVVWGYEDLVGEEYGTVQVEEDGVATVTAIAKGSVSFKFRATIEGVDYLSSIVKITVMNNDNEYVIPENAYPISNASQFKAYFNAATYASRNGVLLNDIDLGGDTVVGMAGEFDGIFEGQGYKVSNYKGKALFNIVKANSEVRNFKIEFEVTAGASGALAAINNGLIKNVKVMVTVKTGINSYGGISQTGSGQFVDCHVDWIISNATANTLHAIVEVDSGKRITNCSWTMNGSTTAVGSGGNAQVTRNLVREGALGFQLLVMGYEGGDIVTEECAAKWAAANTKWNAISADSRQQVKTIAEFEDAWLRYQNWALANGSTPDEGTGSGLKTNNNLNLTATIIIGAIGLTTLVGYYFINKKKVHA